MEDSKKSGFTLIELLAVIVVLVLIFSITFFFSGNIFGGVADKVDKTTKKMILDATNEYVLEYRNKEWWKEDINDSGDITFCVSLESLLETGYYDSDDKYVLENKDKLLVSAVIDSKKVIKYDLIDYNDAKDKCNYSFNESLLDKDNGKIDIMDDNNENSIGSLEYNVDKIDNNNYDVNINFLAELGIKNIEVDAPVYVAIILDNSGSMIGDSWNNAKKAAINLSEKVINELDDSYIALIQYSDSPLLVRNFEKKALSNSSFIAPYGGTNVSGSLDLTASLYKRLDVPDYAMLYAILLYDGLPTYYSYLYNTSNKKNLYNSSTTLYYDNFLTAYYGANNSYNYLYNPNPNISGFDPSVYINNASNYLKSNNSNLRLITIGYNFDESSSNSNDLKEISSIDNNFCANSDYKVDTTVEKETELNSINNVDMKTHQITYPFVYNKTNGSLSSSNVGIMTESYGYYELDLTEYSENDEIELFIDYTLINPQDRDYLLVIISDFEERNASKFTASGCYVSKWSDYENYYSYCDYSSGTTKKNIMGGKKYYVHVYYEHNGAANYYHTDFEKKGAVVINKFSYSLVKNELIYDSSVSGYNSEDLINLSSVSESQLVYDPVIKDDKLILSGLTSNSISGAYEKIDLSNKEGTYLLTINAASNNDMGIIYISNSPVAVFPPAKYKAFGSITDFNFDNYAIENVCQAENSRCIFQKTPANDYHFKLDGGKIYYVHFVNQTNFWGNYKEGVANFIINEISLLKVGNEISNVDMNTISDDMCLDDSLNYVSCLKDSDTYEFKFIQNNGSIISTNKEIKDSCSHSYVELDLTEYGSNELVVVSFNSTSSSSPYASSLKSLDLSNIIITETKDAPNLNKMACDIRNDNDCVLIAISGSRNSYARLSGGKKYYVHFMYCKNTTGSYNDYFSINKMNIYEGLDNISTKFPIDTSLGFTDIVKYDNYSFKEFDNSLVSTNNGVGNSISHSYLKLDLSKYDSNDRFLLEIDDFASHGDSGKIIMTNEKEVPRYYNFLAYNSFKNILISSNSGNNVAKTNSEIIHGGEIYYLHLMYIKNETKDYYDDIYRIDGVRIYKIVSNEEKLLDFSKDKYQFKNYSFVKEDNKYVSSNSEPYTSSYSYFELDLTNYSSNRKFILDIEANLEIINNGSGFAKIYISPSDSIPWFYYNTGGADKITRYSITTSSNNYSTELTGGQKYYVHFSSTNYNGKIKTTISSIELKEIVSTGNNYYCYYDSDEEKVEGIFANLSTKVISSVPKLTAKSAKIKLSTVKNENVVFHIEDFDGNRTEYIEENINLTNESFELNDKYRFVLDKVSGCNEEKCTLQLKLFNVEIELVYDDDKVKIISLDDEMIPLVTIEYENGKAIN